GGGGTLREGDLMEDEEVPLVDGVFEGALGSLALEMEALVDAIENDVFAFDGAVRFNTLKLKKLMNFFRSRKVGMMWSFGFLEVCKRTKIPFVCEDGLAIEWNSKDLTELFKGESDEFVLNHEGDKNEAEVISLKSDLTIKLQNKRGIIGSLIS
nr:hypothetical protein [Tanacetum cinerariifolium]